MKDIEFLYDLCELVEKKGRELTERLKGKEIPMNETSLEIIDKLTHIMKSLSCVIAMEEEKQGGGESYSTVNTTDGANSYRGGSYRGGSYRESMADGISGARGRRNAPRDSMGRYSGRSYDDGGYAGAADELIEHLEHAKEMAEDHSMKQQLQKIIREAQNM